MGLLVLFATAAAAVIGLGTWAALHRLTHPPRVTFAVALARRLPTSPADLGFRFAERTFRLSDGSDTPAWVIEGEDAAGPVVVISHSWGDSRYGSLLWARLVAPYAAAIVCYDLRGHGESGAGKSRLATTEADDLLHLIEQLDLRDSPLVLMGLSLGGGVSIAAASKLGDRAAGVIGDGVYRRGMEPIAQYFRLNDWPVQPFVWLLGAHLAFWYMGPRAFDRAAHATHLTCLLLLLHGKLDPICPYTSAQEIAAAAPRGRLVTFETGGHLNLFGTDAARYVEALRGFFSAVRAESSKRSTETRREDETRRREQSMATDGHG